MSQVLPPVQWEVTPRVVRSITLHRPHRLRIPIVVQFILLFYRRLTSLFVPATRQKGFIVTDVQSVAVRKQMSVVLAQHAHHAGQYLALSNDGWRILWSDARDCFIAFQERNFTVITWRDPIGPASERVKLLHRFHHYAQARGKQAILMWISEESARELAYKQYKSLWIGTEPYFDLATYSTRGKAGENLRHSLNSAKKIGAVAREIDPLRNAADREAMLAVERAWKAERSIRSTRSFLRTAPLEFVHSRRYFAVEVPGPDGPLMQGFIICSPIGARGWCMQDLVRLPDAPRGIIELGIMRAMEVLKAEGIEFVSMTLIPFHDPSGEKSLAILSRLEQWAITYFDRMYHFTGLQQFRTKFAPTSCQHSYVLFWPKILTPMALADIISVMAPRKSVPLYDPFVAGEDALLPRKDQA